MPIARDSIDDAVGDRARGCQLWAHERASGGCGVGQHTLAARVVNGYMWPNKVVTLAAGDVYTDTLPFYCS